MSEQYQQPPSANNPQSTGATASAWSLAAQYAAAPTYTAQPQVPYQQTANPANAAYQYQTTAQATSYAYYGHTYPQQISYDQSQLSGTTESLPKTPQSESDGSRSKVMSMSAFKVDSEPPSAQINTPPIAAGTPSYAAPPVVKHPPVMSGYQAPSQPYAQFGNPPPPTASSSIHANQQFQNQTHANPQSFASNSWAQYYQSPPPQTVTRPPPHHMSNPPPQSMSQPLPPPQSMAKPPPPQSMAKLPPPQSMAKPPPPQSMAKPPPPQSMAKPPPPQSMAKPPPPQSMAKPPPPQSMAKPPPQPMAKPPPQSMAKPPPQEVMKPPPVSMGVPPPQSMARPPPHSIMKPLSQAMRNPPPQSVRKQAPYTPMNPQVNSSKNSPRPPTTQPPIKFNPSEKCQANSFSGSYNQNTRFPVPLGQKRPPSQSAPNQSPPNQSPFDAKRPKLSSSESQGNKPQEGQKEKSSALDKSNASLDDQKSKHETVIDEPKEQPELSSESKEQESKKKPLQDKCSQQDSQPKLHSKETENSRENSESDNDTIFHRKIYQRQWSSSRGSLNQSSSEQGNRGFRGRTRGRGRGSGNIPFGQFLNNDESWEQSRNQAQTRGNLSESSRGRGSQDQGEPRKLIFGSSFDLRNAYLSGMTQPINFRNPMRFANRGIRHPIGFQGRGFPPNQRMPFGRGQLGEMFSPDNFGDPPFQGRGGFRGRGSYSLSGSNSEPLGPRRNFNPARRFERPREISPRLQFPFDKPHRKKKSLERRLSPKQASENKECKISIGKFLSPRPAIVILEEFLQNNPYEFKFEDPTEADIINFEKKHEKKPNILYKCVLQMNDKTYFALEEHRKLAKEICARKALPDIALEKFNLQKEREDQEGMPLKDREDEIPYENICSFALFKMFEEWSKEGLQVPDSFFNFYGIGKLTNDRKKASREMYFGYYDIKDIDSDWNLSKTYHLVNQAKAAIANGTAFRWMIESFQESDVNPSETQEWDRQKTKAIQLVENQAKEPKKEEENQKGAEEATSQSDQEEVMKPQVECDDPERQKD